MAYETILVETRGPVGLITLNRPKALNALNSQVISEINQALRGFEADPEIAVIVLTGSERAFAAGADVKEMQDKDFMAAYQSDFIGPWQRVAGRRKPIIAAVAGYALGGGCELAMSCDLRVASERARFGQPEINLGLIPGGGGTQRLPRLVGTGHAMRLILTGDMIGAAEAREIGLVDLVFPAEELREKTLEIAQKIASFSPLTVRVAKESIRASELMSIEEGILYERDLFCLCFSTEDKKEGVEAFLAKRRPTFKGR